MTQCSYMAGKKLLVADDSLTIQKVIRLALSNEGYDIQTVSDGNDAVQQITVFRPDLVLIDISLPGLNAFEVKRSINQHEDLQHVNFVLLSSAFEKIDEAQASEVLFQGRLTKPFDPAHLRQTLTEVLNKKRESEPLPTQTLGTGQIPISDFNNDFAPMPPMPPLAMDIPGISPPLAPPPGPAFGTDEIKHLTDSTLKMNPMEDFPWSVQEPELKPLPGMMPDADFPPPFDAAAAYHQAPPPFTSAPATQAPAPIPEPVAVPVSTPEPTPVSSSNLESVVHQQLEQALGKAIQKLLPDIAERLIKEEIRRLLSDESALPR